MHTLAESRLGWRRYADARAHLRQLVRGYAAARQGEIIMERTRS